MLMLNIIDNQWKDHLFAMDHLKEHIGMRSYGQKDPLVEYKKESYELFKDLRNRIEDETVKFLYFMQRVEDVPQPSEDVYEELPEAEAAEPEPEPMEVAAAREAEAKAAQASVIDFTRSIQKRKEHELEQLQMLGAETSTTNQPVIAKKQPGRNDPCYCGSGKKFKKCHGA
jgi:preprotein translocase subunit SecA